MNLRYAPLSFAVFLLACGDDAPDDPIVDAGPSPTASFGDASPPNTFDGGDAEAGADAASSIDADVASDAAVDGEVAPVCPFTMTLDGPLVEQVVIERALEAPTGGTITAGTYALTARELVIEPTADEVDKQTCRDQLPMMSRESLQFTSSSDMAGRVITRASQEQGGGFSADYVSESDYRVEGTTLTLRSLGVACVTTISPAEDGGSVADLSVFMPDKEDRPSAFSATADTVALHEVVASQGELAVCTFVSTYRR